MRKVRETGRVAERAPPRPAGDVPEKARELGGSAQVWCVDAGFCNACEIKIAAAFNPELAGGYGVEGAVSDVVPVDLAVPGCGCTGGSGWTAAFPGVDALAGLFMAVVVLITGEPCCFR
ncbi:hypothetical protein [Streptomyces sp. NPDC096132]|uniref:hypothetical protein n=1 Tax=Streptomyces sp. NPDC096132 TaxID=3366075 RepID=UPI0038223E8E